MYMILHLYKERFLDDILMALTETGVEDTIILEGQTLGHKLISDMPLFSGFRQSFGTRKGFAKIIMAMAEQEQIDTFIQELKNSGIDILGDEIANIVLIPIEKQYLFEG